MGGGPGGVAGSPEGCRGRLTPAYVHHLGALHLHHGAHLASRASCTVVYCTVLCCPVLFCVVLLSVVLYYVVGTVQSAVIAQFIELLHIDVLFGFRCSLLSSGGHLMTVVVTAKRRRDRGNFLLLEDDRLTWSAAVPGVGPMVQHSLQDPLLILNKMSQIPSSRAVCYCHRSTKHPHR